MVNQANTQICQNKFSLRTIINEDAEILRLWKNKHKEFFFHNIDISKEQQQSWMKSYYSIPNDFMFIIFDSKTPVGCLGARLIDDYVDVYNVILGDKYYKGKHVMTDALWAVVSFCMLIFPNAPIKVRVLKTNPAIKWYEKIGFYIVKKHETYVEMIFNKDLIINDYNFNIDINLPIKK